MSRLLAPMALVGLVLAGLHYGREGGPGTTARGASLDVAGSGLAPAPSPRRPEAGTPGARALEPKIQVAFSLGRDTRGSDVVFAADTAAMAAVNDEIAGRLNEGGFHI